MSESMILFFLGESVFIAGIVFAAYVKTSVSIAKLESKVNTQCKAIERLQVEADARDTRIQGLSRHVERLEAHVSYLKCLPHVNNKSSSGTDISS